MSTYNILFFGAFLKIGYTVTRLSSTSGRLRIFSALMMYYNSKLVRKSTLHVAIDTNDISNDSHLRPSALTVFTIARKEFSQR